MSTATHPPETDLLVPLPGEGESWDPHTIHTHYFGFSVPEAELGAFIYVRYMPTFPLCQGGVCIFRGLENTDFLDAEFVDYQITMPWPRTEGNSIETANGLRFEFPEPGERARIGFESRDGSTSFQIEQTAVTPLLARGHIVPGEETDTDSAQAPGGTEQFMRCTGELVLSGDRHEVDCYAVRDRSWRQVRSEDQGGAAPIPSVCWTPMCFGEDLIFNQISFEAPDTDPAWAGGYEIPADTPTHHFAWLVKDGDVREITRVRRNVLAYHPVLHAAMRQEVEAEEADGTVHRFSGEALAMAPIPAWPNATFRDSVYRWEAEDGRLAHGTCQELWPDRYQRLMRERAASA